MRDLVVREAIVTMAVDAADCFRDLLAEGAEIPYDVREPGEGGSPLPQYVPLTHRFVREHAASLRALDSFGAACAALESADLAAPYLEAGGVPVPPEARQRAELACVVLLCRLWADSTDFSLPDERLRAVIDEIQSAGEISDDQIEVVVPLRGLQMDATRLELATATLVRADTVEVPAEARASEGSGVAAWEPTFVAVTRVGAPVPSADGEEDERQPDAGARAVEAFRQLITTLRLFKGGGVALGPHAWTRSGGDRWRRIATGAGRPRPGGYRLSEAELSELVAFSRTIAGRLSAFGSGDRRRPSVAPALRRAISRFEAGLERQAMLDALNDYLLALRFVLESGGPADLGLAMRVAALCSEPERRGDTKQIVDRAITLERELWSGEPAPAGDGAPSPAQTALAIEELVRAILKDAACGHLGADLRATADEILLADGLAVGEGAIEQRGETSEWQPGEDGEELEEVEPVEDAEPIAVPLEAVEEPSLLEADAPGTEVTDEDLDWEDAFDGDPEPAAPRFEPAPFAVPEPAGDITIAYTDEHEEEHLHPTTPIERIASRPRPPAEEPVRSPGARSGEPTRLQQRVAYLFPRPETCEWDVGELAYDRRRRAARAGRQHAS
jgi:hypothetical protein